MTPEQFNQLALSFPNTVASPHFDRTAYKALNKRIFATLHLKSETVNLKLSPKDQSVYCLIDKTVIYPVNNKWGLQGWTTCKLENIDSQLLFDALELAYKQSIL